MDSASPPPAPERSPRASNGSPEPAKRPADDADAPAKRARNDARKTEDRARGKRLFGNLLGTLRKFQDDDKSSRTSEAAKRREQTASRIADKLRAEHAAMDNLQTAERELRTLRVGLESAAYVLEHKEIAISTRHSALRATQPYLSTSTTPRPHPQSALYPPPPAPLALPPSNKATVPPLYFRPKILTPSQEEALSRRNEEVAKLITEEEEALARERGEVRDSAVRGRERVAELEERVRTLRGELGDRAPAARSERRGERMEEDGEGDGDREEEGEGDGEVFVGGGGGGGGEGDDMEVEY